MIKMTNFTLFQIKWPVDHEVIEQGMKQKTVQQSKYLTSSANSCLGGPCRRLIATTVPSRSKPLYTIPKLPAPTTFLSLKFFVACCNSSSVNCLTAFRPLAGPQPAKELLATASLRIRCRIALEGRNNKMQNYSCISILVFGFLTKYRRIWRASIRISVSQSLGLQAAMRQKPYKNHQQSKTTCSSSNNGCKRSRHLDRSLTRHGKTKYIEAEMANRKAKRSIITTQQMKYRYK